MKWPCILTCAVTFKLVTELWILIFNLKTALNALLACDWMKLFTASTDFNVNLKEINMGKRTRHNSKQHIRVATNNYINLLAISALKCTKVESAVKLNTKKVVLLHTHTQWRLHHSSVALLVVRCSKPCHNVIPFIFWFFSEAELLLNYMQILVHWVQIWLLEPKTWRNKRGISHFRSLKWETMTEEVHTRSADSVSLIDIELTIDLTHNRQMLLSQKHVMVIHVR